MPLSWSALVEPKLDGGMSQQIFFELRLPRLLLGVLAGASLALCGGLLQDLSRNQLADPYLFGIVAGAAFGATIVTVWLPNLSIALPIAAFIGALLAISLVIAFVSVNRRNQLEHWVLGRGCRVLFAKFARVGIFVYGRRLCRQSDHVLVNGQSGESTNNSGLGNCACALHDSCDHYILAT